MKIAIVRGGFDGIQRQNELWREEGEEQELLRKEDRIRAEYWIARCKLIVRLAQIRINREGGNQWATK